MPGRSTALLATCALLALSAAACGQSDPQQIRSTMENFGQAIAERDYGTLCGDILASELVGRVRSVGLDCPVALSMALGAVQSPRLEVLDVDIEGDQALARVRTSAQGQEPSEDAVRLVKQEGEWRVASLSAAQPQPPASAPEHEHEHQADEP